MGNGVMIEDKRVGMAWPRVLSNCNFILQTWFTTLSLHFGPDRACVSRHELCEPETNQKAHHLC